MGPGPEIQLGAWISIFWPDDDKFYDAEVLDYDVATGTCEVLYNDDGKREKLDLTQEKYRILRARKLRGRMGKGGTAGLWSRNQPKDVAEKLLDIEDRLPPKGVYISDDIWWNTWANRVRKAGKSGDVPELRKAAVELAFQMKDSVSTDWWNSQRLIWQKQVESSTTSKTLSDCVNEFDKHAVIWDIATGLFPVNSEEKNKVVQGPAPAPGRRGVNTNPPVVDDGVKMDPPVVDAKGTPSRRETRLQARMGKRSNDTGGNVEEDGGVKRPSSNSTPRRSKRIRSVIGDDEEHSVADTPGISTPSVTRSVNANAPSLPKKKKGDKLVKSRSDTGCPEDQSSVDETEKKRNTRKRQSVEDKKQEKEEEEGVEDGQESSIDVKTEIVLSRGRRPRRCLKPDRDETGQTSETGGSGKNVGSTSAEPVLETRNEAGQTSQTEGSGKTVGSLSAESVLDKQNAAVQTSDNEAGPTSDTEGSGKNVGSMSAEPVLEKQNSIISSEREDIQELKDITLSVSCPSSRSRIEFESGIADSKGFSGGGGSGLVQEGTNAEDGPEQLEQASDVEVQSGRPKTAIELAMEADDEAHQDDSDDKTAMEVDEDGKDKTASEPANEADGDDTASERANEADGDDTASEPANEADGDDTVEGTLGTESHGVLPAVQDSNAVLPNDSNVVEADDSKVVIPNVIVTGLDVVETDESKVVKSDVIVTRAKVKREILEHISEFEKVDAGDDRAEIDIENAEQSPGVSTLKNLGLSAQESHVVMSEVRVTQVEVKREILELTSEVEKVDDGHSRPEIEIEDPAELPAELPGVSTPKDLGLLVQESHVVTSDVRVPQVEVKREILEHTFEVEEVDNGHSRLEIETQNPAELPGVSTPNDLGLSAQESHIVESEVRVTRVEVKQENTEHTSEIEKHDDDCSRLEIQIKNTPELSAVNTPKSLVLSVHESHIVTSEDRISRVETRLESAVKNGVGSSGEIVGRLRRVIRKPKKYDAADVESPRPTMMRGQMERRLVTIGPSAEAKRTDLLKAADTRAESANGISHPVKVKQEASVDREGLPPGEWDGAGPSMIQNDVRPRRRGHLVRKSSESKLTKDQGGEMIDYEEATPPTTTGKGKELILNHAPMGGSEMLQNEADRDEQHNSQDVNPTHEAGGSSLVKPKIEAPVEMDEEELQPVSNTFQKRNPRRASRARKSPEPQRRTRQARGVARSEGMRMRSGKTRNIIDESDEDDSSGEEEKVRNRKSGRRNSHKRRRSQSSDSNYEESASSASSQEDSLQDESEEEDKVEDDAEDPGTMEVENSWGQRLSPDNSDAEDDVVVPKEETQALPDGEAASVRPPMPSFEDPEAARCAICDFSEAADSMLLCDGRNKDNEECKCAMHTFCLTPPLHAVPEGQWLCPHCIRVRRNPADARRIPKCSSAKYPPKTIHSIIGRRKSTLEQLGITGQMEPRIEYLIKWDFLSHEHDTWVPEDFLLYINRTMFFRFQKKTKKGLAPGVPPPKEFDYRKPEWVQIDRIISCRRQGTRVFARPAQVLTLLQSRQEEQAQVEFLVKWQALGYQDATWEQERKTEAFQQAISAYAKRHEQGEESGSREMERKPVASIKIPPDYLSGDPMYEFQLHGLKWLLSNYEQRRSVILADEMGLGKTVQALAFISCIRYENLSSKPVLVVAPKSTLSGWMKEFRKWIPGLNVVKYQGDKNDRALIRQHEFYTASKKPLFEVLLMNNELASVDKEYLNRFQWGAMIVDEGHRVKNIYSKLGADLLQMKSEFRLLLTGTPVQNTLTELFTLLHFLDPVEFRDPEKAAEKFSDVDAQNNKAQSDRLQVQQSLSNIHELLNPRMLRRLKMEVMKDLIPLKKVVEVSCALTPYQRRLYTAILSKDYSVINKNVKSGRKRSLLQALTNLKLVCNHPYLIPGKEPVEPNVLEQHKLLVDVSGKLQLLEKLLPALQQQGHRVLLFSQMTTMMNILEDFLSFNGFKYARIDGSRSAVSREASIEEFNAPGSTTFIFLISTRAGGLGINLPTADTVIMYDPDFNPFVDLQAQARAHRIGQDKPVIVYQLITKCSVEEKIVQRSRKKLAMENLVTRKDYTDNEADIETLLVHGLSKVLDEHSAEDTYVNWTDDKIAKLLDREILPSTSNADEPTAQGYLGAVHGVVKEEQSAAADASAWHTLLKHHIDAEPDEIEELGRGKRQRKAVMYANDGGGHAVGQEEEEYNPSIHSDESSEDESMEDEGRIHGNRAGHQYTGNFINGAYHHHHMQAAAGYPSSSHNPPSAHHFIPGRDTILTNAPPAVYSQVHPLARAATGPAVNSQHHPYPQNHLDAMGASGSFVYPPQHHHATAHAAAGRCVNNSQSQNTSVMPTTGWDANNIKPSVHVQSASAQSFQLMGSSVSVMHTLPSQAPTAANFGVVDTTPKRPSFTAQEQSFIDRCDSGSASTSRAAWDKMLTRPLYPKLSSRAVPTALHIGSATTNRPTQGHLSQSAPTNRPTQGPISQSSPLNQPTQGHLSQPLPTNRINRPTQGHLSQAATTNRPMQGHLSQYAGVQTGAGLTTQFLDINRSAGLTSSSSSIHAANPKASFHGAYSSAADSSNVYNTPTNAHSTPAYSGVRCPDPSAPIYMPWNGVQPLASKQHPVPSQYNRDGQRVLKQVAAQGWRMADGQRNVSPGTVMMETFGGGGSYVSLSGQQQRHGVAGGGAHFPASPSSPYQAAHTLLPVGSVAAAAVARQQQFSSVFLGGSGSMAAAASQQQSRPKPVKDNSSKVNTSPNLPYNAAAAPWLAGYCTEAPAPVLSGRVPSVPQVSAMSGGGLHVPPIQQTSGIPFISDSSLPEFEFLDPTALQEAATVATTIPPTPKSPNLKPRLDSFGSLSLSGRYGSSPLVSAAEAPSMTLPDVGTVGTVPTLRMPQSQLLGKAFDSSAGETNLDAVDGMLLGGGVLNQFPPVLDPLGNPVLIEGDCEDLSLQMEIASGPKQLPLQIRKPLWEPKGDAGLLMKHLQDPGPLP